MSRLRVAASVAAAQLRHDRARTVLAVVGIAVAVLSTTLLASLGYGVFETGQQKFDASGRDLWVTGGSLSKGPGGFGTSILDAHNVSRDIESRERVESAVPMAFQAVYVGNGSGEMQTLVGVGVPGGGPFVSYEKGELPHGDGHYQNGTYNGTMHYDIVIDPRTAEMLDVGVGDTIYVGGSVESAREHEFEVTGISSTFSSFLGAPTVTTYLSELQEVTGTTGTDKATFITVNLKEGANTSAVERELQRAYPDYTIRTNDEQMRSVLRHNAVVIAVGGALVVLAVVAGFALTLNVLSIVVFQQKEELAALTALGVSSKTVVGMVAAQGVLLGAVGGLVGVAVTPPFVAGLNYVAAEIVGFEGLVQAPGSVLVLGGAIALVIGTLAAAVAGWRTLRTVGVDQLMR
ncbi:ABC transporter permease [Halorussus sp. MSC15.2]|uniref:ABC transporter permease n=1 Tax=Halorussus sp. MSC15.2 TaxID=2283638 RepID=UPI0013CFFBDF|nr:ABC transporter permease [Halorussus sp. MSC15.2]NEU58087.1 ABC transporter permease [Halorussus sp. MSC15.2]